MEDGALKKAMVEFLADVLIEAKARMGKVVEASLKEALEKQRLLVKLRSEELESREDKRALLQPNSSIASDELWTLDEFTQLMKFPTADAARRFIKTHLPPECRVSGVGRRVKLIPSRVRKALGLST